MLMVKVNHLCYHNCANFVIIQYSMLPDLKRLHLKVITEISSSVLFDYFAELKSTWNRIMHSLSLICNE